MDWFTDHAGVWIYWLSALALFIYGIRFIGRRWDNLKEFATNRATYRRFYSAQTYLDTAAYYRWLVAVLIGAVLLCGGLSCGWPGTLIVAFFVWQFHSGVKKQRKQKQRAKEAAELEAQLAEEQRKNQALVQGVMQEMGWDNPTFLQEKVAKKQP